MADRRIYLIKPLKIMLRLAIGSLVLLEVALGVLMAPLLSRAEMVDSSASGNPLTIIYECHLSTQVQQLLASGQWRAGDAASQVTVKKGTGNKVTENKGNISQVTSDRALHGVLESNEGLCKIHLEKMQDFGISSPQELSFEVSQLQSAVRDAYPFSGMAAFYNNVLMVHRRTDGELVFDEKPGDETTLGRGEWWGWKGRYHIVLLSAPGARLSLGSDNLALRWPGDSSESLIIYLGDPRAADEVLSPKMPDFDDFRYAHLWDWLGGISRLVEWSLIQLQVIPGIDWGLAIVILAVLVKLLLLPVSLLTVRLQRNVNSYQLQLTPQLTEIKAKYDGEEAHKRITAAHKELGITPFYTLRPLFASLIQIPILIAIFNALGEMPQLNGASFLWIDNLAYPDTVVTLPFHLPMLGDGLNLLPIFMTLVSLISIVFFRNLHVPPEQIRRQRRNLYIMTAVFFVLFYPFPAAMVLYWTLVNALQLVQQRVFDQC